MGFKIEHSHTHTQCVSQCWVREQLSNEGRENQRIRQKRRRWSSDNKWTSICDDESISFLPFSRVKQARVKKKNAVATKRKRRRKKTTRRTVSVKQQKRHRVLADKTQFRRHSSLSLSLCLRAARRGICCKRLLPLLQTQTQAQTNSPKKHLQHFDA